jgi:hypothetical protein
MKREIPCIMISKLWRWTAPTPLHALSKRVGRNEQKISTLNIQGM